MAERQKNMRERLLLAGIDEINTQGVTGFSIRRVAENCGVSCAAPYKHFKDKRDFIASIIEPPELRCHIRNQSGCHIIHCRHLNFPDPRRSCPSDLCFQNIRVLPD